MADALVQAAGLTRHFDGRVAVDNLSLSVAAGEVVTLLGPNGAGKTTTFRMLAGLLLPTSGEAKVAGSSLSSSASGAVRARVGLLTEAPGLWERLSVRWNLRTYAHLHGLQAVERRVSDIIDRVGLSDRADERAGALSKGLKQRVALARAILHDPPVVLLDEPTSGLDPESARHVRDLITRLAREGRAVLVSTHNLAEAEEISDRIAILNTHLMAVDAPERLRADQSGTGVIVAVEGAAEMWRAALEALGATSIEAEDSTVTMKLADADGIPAMVASLVNAGARIRRVAPRQRSLEDAYLSLVRRHE
jgi:ABC-2 type transport system ATP-binding protein